MGFGGFVGMGVGGMLERGCVIFFNIDMSIKYYVF